MVTVRLSEPPRLSINTSVPAAATATAAPARSVLAHEYRPSDAMAEAVREEEDSSEALAPSPAAPGQGRNLQDELNGSDGPDDDDNRSVASGAATPTSADAADEVDWDQLQNSEEEQQPATAAQESDNVRILFPHRSVVF